VKRISQKTDTALLRCCSGICLERVKKIAKLTATFKLREESPTGSAFVIKFKNIFHFVYFHIYIYKTATVAVIDVNCGLILQEES